MRLDYDEDNFFGRQGRGQRYDIFVNGILEFHDVCDSECDVLCDRLERQYSRYVEPYEIEVKEI